MAKIPQQRGGKTPPKTTMRGHLENRHNSMSRGGQPWLGGGGGGKKPPGGGCLSVLLILLPIASTGIWGFWRLLS